MTNAQRHHLIVVGIIATMIAIGIVCSSMSTGDELRACERACGDRGIESWSASGGCTCGRALPCP